MPNLFFLRHAESEANAKQEYASRLPIPITENGKSEAKFVAEKLKENVSIDKIISSSLLRAVQTSEYFAKIFALPIELSDEIVEQDLGLYTGKHYDWVKSHPEFESDAANRWDWTPPGNGESYKDISVRVLSFLNKMELERAKNILITTHGVTLKLLLAALKNTLPVYDTSLTRNCEILHCEFKQLGTKHQVESIYYGDQLGVIHGE